MRAALALLPVLLGLALLELVLSRSPSGPVEARSTDRLRRFRQELDALRDLADAPEFRALREGRAFLETVAYGTESHGLELGLMGNLDGYASPCACSRQGRRGGLAVIGAAVRRWRGETALPLVGAGNSLLPEGSYPAPYESLFIEKAHLMARLYRLIGVDVFCPSPVDLRAFDDVNALVEWSTAAGLQSVITNLPKSKEKERIRRQATFGNADFGVVLYAVCDPADPDHREAPARFTLEPLDTTLRACTLPVRGLRVVILHDVPLAKCVDLLPQPLDRTILVARTRGPAAPPRHPVVRSMARRGLIVQPTARGQGLSILQFLSPDMESGTIRNAASEMVVFERAVRQGREPHTLDSTDIRFLATAIAFRGGSAESIGAIPEIRERLAGHRAKVLRRLLADPPYDSDEVPDTRRLLLAAESCGTCHEAQVAGWRAGPHAHALETLLEGERREQAEAGCVRCHLSATSRLALDAPARSKDHPLRMREVLSGVTCITCHADVTDEHPGGRGVNPSPEAARAMCQRCHDSVNSPDFEIESYLRGLGCCSTRPR